MALTPRKDVETDWLNPVFTEEPDIVYMPNSELGFNARRFRMRHIVSQNIQIQGNWGTGGVSAGSGLGLGLGGFPGAGYDIQFHTFDGYIKWMIYEGNDPFKPDFIYIRQKVVLSVTTQIDSLQIGGAAINNAASIPKQKSIITSVINNEPTENYEREPLIEEPEEWAPNPNNPIYLHTTYNKNAPTPYAEDGFWNDYDGDYSGGGGSYFLHWTSVWYDIEIPPSAKLFNPKDRLWDQWQVPTVLNPKRMQFQFEKGNLATDGVLEDFPMVTMVESKGTGVVVTRGAPGTVLTRKNFLDKNRNPSISYDEGFRIRLASQNDTGYYEYVSYDGGATFRALTKLWDKNCLFPKYVFAKAIKAGASVAFIGKALMFKRTDLKQPYLIKVIDKAETYSIIYRDDTNVFEVKNAAGRGFISKDGGKTWTTPDGQPAVSSGDISSTGQALMGKNIYIPELKLQCGIFFKGTSLYFRRSDFASDILIKDIGRTQSYGLVYDAPKNKIIVRNSNGNGFWSGDGGKTWSTSDGKSAT